MQQYKDYLRNILENGVESEDRTGTGTLSVFGTQMRFNLQEGFPLVTLKKTHFKSIVYELLWFIRGKSDVQWLQEHGVTIWDEWAPTEPVTKDIPYKEWEMVQYVLKEKLGGWDNHDNLISHLTQLCGPDPVSQEEFIRVGTDYLASLGAPRTYPIKVREIGDLGRIYPYQWRHFNGHYDQLAKVIENIKKDPYSRRHIVTAWNPTDLEDQALPACHVMFQFYVRGGKLSLHWIQRSADEFLGKPFNIASYALLCHMVAQVCGLKVGDLIVSTGDAHIYKNHIDQVNELLTREPLPLCSLNLNPDIKNIDDFTFDDISIENYVSHPAIKAPVAV